MAFVSSFSILPFRLWSVEVDRDGPPMICRRGAGLLIQIEGTTVLGPEGTERGDFDVDGLSIER